MRYETLDEAVSNLDSEDVARHVAAGADINQRYETDGGGFVTLLVLFASDGERNQVDLLLRHRADANAPDSDGQTPLHAAAGKDHFEVVAVLLANGANPNPKNDHGWTPLHIAAAKGHLRVVKLLIMTGADKQTPNNVGATALLLALNNGKGEVAKILADPDDVKSAVARDIQAARNRQR
jgi:ankyrin repeat protein